MNCPTQYPLLVFALSFIALWLSGWAGWVVSQKAGRPGRGMRKISASSWLLRSR